jgi:hypothetical protein
MRLHRLVHILACSPLLVSACGDDDAGGADTTGATESPTSDPTTPSTTTLDPTADGTADGTTDDGTTDDDTTTGLDTTGDDTTDTGISGCEGEGLPSEVPVQVQGSNVGAGDDHEAPCGWEGGQDVVYLWTAPATGYYSIDTLGSDFDTVLYAYAGDCDGDVLTCNDDADGTLQSRIQLSLERGETIAIVVDAYSSEDTGNYVLSIDEVVPPTCPDEDLGDDLPTTHSGSTVGAGDDYASCGGIGSGGEDVSFVWTAPSSGLYQFDTFGSSFDTILTLAETCDEAFVGDALCNDDAGGTLQSALFYGLDEGESVVVVVDGYGESGNYTLNIDAVPTEGDCCDAEANQDGACEAIDTSACVCSLFAECCSSQWSQVCVGLNNALCGGTCALTPGGSCCEASISPGCDAPVIEECVCALDSFCCAAQGEWDAACVGVAVDYCAAECN